jgi:hypothetical protein
MSLTIKIGGEERPIKFNRYAIILMRKHADPQNYDASVNYAMVYGGLMGAAYVKRMDVDFTFEQVCDWVEELPAETIAAVDAELASCMAWQQAVEFGKKKLEAELQDPDKKKLQPTTPEFYESAADKSAGASTTT